MIKILRENNEIKTIPIECVEGATLLSADEAENLLTEEERECKYQGKPCWWWLRSPGNHQSSAACVSNGGFVYRPGSAVSSDSGCVRPALILNLNSSNLQIGDIFKFGIRKFKVISREYALCEEAVGQCAFKKDWQTEDANVYEKSDIKKFVDNWLNEAFGIYKGIKTDDLIADENDLGF